MKRYVFEFANDMKRKIPDTSAGKELKMKIDKTVCAYKRGLITSCEACRMIADGEWVCYTLESEM